MDQSTGATPGRNSTSTQTTAQPSRPTPEYGAPHIGTDIPAWNDTQHAAWRAFGSNR
jgi:hypothetical protein